MDCIITSSASASTAVAMTTGDVGGVMTFADSGNIADQGSTTTTSTSGNNATPTPTITMSSISAGTFDGG